MPEMSWASNRKTPKVEDMAYCLIGIFDIQEIVEQESDLTLFALVATDHDKCNSENLLSSDIFDHNNKCFEEVGIQLRRIGANIYDKTNYQFTNSVNSQQEVLPSRDDILVTHRIHHLQDRIQDLYGKVIEPYRNAIFILSWIGEHLERTTLLQVISGVQISRS
ncbi:uncharacterized protein Z519_00685 [Cladophialophora bantiana CBS 173.52]|uniref:Uncharacterized protein n=1 Tax=Cladophialophora bantiana (strain ATCC 10958 / CBS 173.52 / CDC B-1940 / NIH 8579) TaxID=1442370 RepID=A0A0D2GKV5_CLAB1|nr:uncharacterized protein Z519_00685 [Cladophialophora bantiana CBS 173.52]KIW99022.1 hypothetical protein Z519_00685 [Cladophialophora bantiana CBS 173.52]